MYWRIGVRWPQIGYVNKELTIHYAERPDSITGSMPPRQKMEAVCEVCDEHLRLSAERGGNYHLESFIMRKVRKWIFIMYRFGQFDMVRSAVKRFDKWLPIGYRILMRFLMGIIGITTRIGKRLILKLGYDQ